MKLAEVIDRTIAIGAEHTPEGREDAFAGTEFLAERAGLDIRELENAALKLADHIVPAMLTDYGPVLTMTVMKAIIATAITEGVLYGVEYERERQAEED